MEAGQRVSWYMAEGTPDGLQVEWTGEVVGHFSEGCTTVQVPDGRQFEIPTSHVRLEDPPFRPEPVPYVPTLDPADPFDAVIIDMVLTNRRKRHDYTPQGGSPWANFDYVERRVTERYGLSPEQVSGIASFVLLTTKDARLDALSTREVPENEAEIDTYRDKAVYHVIEYARRRYPNGKVE